MTTDKQLRKLVAEANKRKQTRASLDFKRPDLLFGPQRDFVEDENHLVAAVCSRRAGKTHGICLKLLSTAFKYEGCIVFYITNTRRQAKRNLWDLTLIPLLRQLGIQAHLNQNELTCRLPNGSMIILGGANDAAEIENYRGTKTPLVVIDEAQAFRSYIETLVEDIFEWQTLDYNGQIYVTGTPNAGCFGYFHDICNKTLKGWSIHHWTMLENPHLPNPEDFIRRKLEKEGMKRTDPRFMRECLGQWVRDTTGLVYGIENQNLLAEMPPWDDLEYVLGIDFGYTDATAFVLSGYSVKHGKIITTESWEREGLIPSVCAEVTHDIMDTYNPIAIVGDMGGLGKAYGEEMLQRYQIPIVAAEKTRKMGAIELLNGDLRTEKLQVFEPGNQKLIEDSRLLQWNYDKVDIRRNGGRTPRLKLEIDDRTPDHLCDAWLYGYRECRAYLHEASPPPKSAKERADAEETALWEALQAKREKDQSSQWDLSQEALAGDESLF